MAKKSKAENPARGLQESASPIVRLYFELSHLKQIYRRGWLQRGIPPGRCESVGEHTFAVVMLAMFLVEGYFPELDPLKILRLALLHDLGEIDAGDLTPSDQVAQVEKSRMERDSVERVLESLPVGSRFVDLWEEYNAGVSPEARFVRQVEKLEMAFQALVYERQGFEELDDFFESAGMEIEDRKLWEILAELKRLRD